MDSGSGGEEYDSDNSEDFKVPDFMKNLEPQKKKFKGSTPTPSPTPEKQLVKYSNVDAVTSAISRKNRQDRAQRRGENTFSPTDSEYLDISSSSDEEYEGMYLLNYNIFKALSK